MMKLFAYVFLQLLVFTASAQAVVCLANNVSFTSGGTPSSIGHQGVTQIFQSSQNDVEILGINASKKIILNKGDRLKYERSVLYYFSAITIEESVKSYTNVSIIRIDGKIETLELIAPEEINTENLNYSIRDKGFKTIVPIKLILPLSKHVVMP